LSTVSATATPTTTATPTITTTTTSRVTPGPAPQTPFFSDLLGHTLGDLWRLPSAETATWLGIGAAAAWGSYKVDRPVSSWMSGISALDGPLEAGNLIGGAQAQFGGAFATYTLGRLTGRPQIAALGTDLLRAQLLAQVVTGAVKVSVQRTRPDGTHLSFPSGHASVSFASATVLERRYGWKVGIPAYGVATYIAAARIKEKRHFLSDVAFGAAIGVVAGRTVTVGKGDARFAIAPMATPGGAGVSVTWIDRR
jgi:membrane-associated phospholipid phosphatase